MNFLVYGWKESNTKFLIDFDWLFDHGIRRFKTYDCAVYGIKCDPENMLSYNQIKMVDNAFIKSKEYNEFFNLTTPKLGYYTAFAHFNMDQEMYDADSEDNSYENDVDVDEVAVDDNESYVEYVPEYDEIYDGEENDVFE